MHRDARTNASCLMVLAVSSWSASPIEVGEFCELAANKVVDVNSPPLVPDEQVLIGGKRPNAIGEALDEIFGIFGGGLASDSVHNADRFLGR
jgi:hypothetical protein